MMTNNTLIHVDIFEHIQGSLISLAPLFGISLPKQKSVAHVGWLQTVKNFEIFLP